MVELTGLSYRREQRKEGGVMARFGPGIEAVVASQRTYDLTSDTLPRILKHVGLVRAQPGGRGIGARRASLRARSTGFAEDMDLARGLIEVYRPYIQELFYTFHGVNIRELYTPR